MKMEQNNKLKMAQTTLACLQEEDHAGAWKGIVGIEEAVARLDEAVSGILACSQKQSARTGFTAQKEQARTAMLQTAFTVCSALKAFASVNDDPKLFAQADFSRSDLARGREADVINRCQSILVLGQEQADALAAKYNVSANDLKALKASLATFGNVQSKPRQSRASVASATSELKGLFDELDTVLNHQIDPLLEKFRFANAAFFSAYQTARSIVDNAASHATKDETPAPLAKAA